MTLRSEARGEDDYCLGRPRNHPGPGYVVRWSIGRNPRRCVLPNCASVRGCDPVAQLSLAEMYHDGQRTPQDYEESVRWYRKAADELAEAKYHLAIAYSL